MDVDLAVEQALDADADMEMDEGEAEAGQGAAAEEDDNGQIDPLGHVKGGRGAALYHAPLLHRIRDGMARLREIRMAEEMSMCANTAGGAGVTPSADASGRAGVGVASVGGSGTVVQHWGGKKGAGMEADQPQQQAQPGQEHDHAHEVGQSQQQLEQLCAELDAAATEQQQGPDDQKHEQQQQQQQQQPHSATTGTTNPRTQQPTQAAGPQSSERVMHLYGFVIQRTPQPSHDLMGPLGVPIYDATSMWEHAQGDAHCAPPRVAPPPCPWPQPPAGTPSDLGAAEQEDVLAAVRAAAATAMAVDSTGQQQQQQQQQQQVSAPFTNGNAEEVEPGWRFHGSCAGPAFGHARASWLHPFGLLLHQLLPPAALPPFRWVCRRCCAGVGDSYEFPRLLLHDQCMTTLFDAARMHLDAWWAARTCGCGAFGGGPLEPSRSCSSTCGAQGEPSFRWTVSWSSQNIERRKQTNPGCELDLHSYKIVYELLFNSLLRL
eukprot:1162113-Pelagomonas_calceolata.AAC.2